MRCVATGCILSVGVVSCNFAPLPRLDGGMDNEGVVSLSASPSVFILHQNDTRETTLTLNNGTSEAIELPSEFTVSGLVGGRMAFSGQSCGGQLAARASCTATAGLVATASAQTDFQVSLGAASVTLSMTAMPACPATCGASGTTNCCASSVVPGNAVGATLAGDLFYRDYDNATDGRHSTMAATAEVSDFRLDTYLVTVGRFRAFVNAGMGTTSTAPASGAGAHARIDGSGWDTAWNSNLALDHDALVAAVNCEGRFQTWTNAPGMNESLPMDCISWYDAMAFCIWDGGYLPSEAEWNYAASGGMQQRVYPWSGPDNSTSVDCAHANYSRSSPYCVTTTTANYAANRVGSESPTGDGRWGQADLAGNMSEWTLDWYNSYPAECTNCANMITGTQRVLRGGSFYSDVEFLRAAQRTVDVPTLRIYDYGVRCARTP